MGLPSKRLSKARSRSRAAHHALDKKVLGQCASCKAPIMPHHACASCGASNTHKTRSVSA